MGGKGRRDTGVELPAASVGGRELTDDGADGTTADDETDLGAAAEIALAGEGDGDGGAWAAMGGGIAEDPKEVVVGGGRPTTPGVVDGGGRGGGRGRHGHGKKKAGSEGKGRGRRAGWLTGAKWERGEDKMG